MVNILLLPIVFFNCLKGTDAFRLHEKLDALAGVLSGMAAMSVAYANGWPI